MKKRMLAALLALLALLTTASAAPVVTPAAQMRGVWVSTVMNLDYPAKPSANANDLRSQADAILDRCAALGFNAVFLQVRPSSDALYSSSIFPWSVYLTGEQGKAPASSFDPLAYWVEGAHKRGMELHAWLNPYRITKKGDEEWKSLADTNPAKLHPEWTVKYDGNYYYDPALPDVQRLVLSGAAEIVARYAVDGIHLDDYFYPAPDFDDDASFKAYGAGFSSRDDWRRDNVNQLVTALNTELHKLRPSLSFGISPAGIWDNAPGNPRGSATRGRSSYSQIYCDSLYWIEHGLVDYICPQIYWNIGYEVANFSILLDWWADAVKDSDVKLYIGMAPYRSAEAADETSVWYGSAELDRQLSMVDDSGKAAGTVQFRYGSIAGNTALSALYTERFSVAPDLPVSAPEPIPAEPETPPLTAPEGYDEAAALLDLFSLFLYSVAH